MPWHDILVVAVASLDDLLIINNGSSPKPWTDESLRYLGADQLLADSGVKDEH